MVLSFLPFPPPLYQPQKWQRLFRRFLPREYIYCGAVRMELSENILMKLPEVPYLAELKQSA